MDSYNKNKKSIYKINMTKQTALEMVGGEDNKRNKVEKIYEALDTRHEDNRLRFEGERLKRLNKQIVLNKKSIKQDENYQSYKRPDYSKHVRKLWLSDSEDSDQELFDDLQEKIREKESTVKAGIQHQNNQRENMTIEGYFVQLVPQINDIMKNKIFYKKHLETFEDKVQ